MSTDLNVNKKKCTHFFCSHIKLISLFYLFPSNMDSIYLLSTLIAVASISQSMFNKIDEWAFLYFS